MESELKLKIDKYGTTPLHWAVAEGTSTVQLLLKFFDPNVVDNLGHTPLHYAAKLGRLDVVRILLRHGANPNARNILGMTPLHLADADCELVETLLHHGADPYARDEFGNTPLHLIIRRLSGGDSCVVESFIAYAKDIADIQNDFGNTLLHEALEYRRNEEALILIDYVRDVNVKNVKGQTPLHLAAITDVQAVEKLLLRGADPNARDVNGWTPLHYAAKYCRLEEAILLLDWGADPNARDNSGKTPLHYAVEQYRRDNDCLRIVELLSQ